jgi:dihydrofolate reductase
MRRVLFFMMVSLDGYFEGDNRDIDWHNTDEEFNDFAIAQLNEVDTLLFGRVTFDMMAAYWPTEAAIRDDPVVAGQMNSLQKIVFSKTLTECPWQNTRLVKQHFAAEAMKLKQQPGKDMIILGSSRLAVMFLEHSLLDEARIMVNPVVLGRGQSVFHGINDRLRLRLVRTRTFLSGNVLLHYEPVKRRRPT